MKLGIREIIYLNVMVALLACTYVFVFQKANKERERLLSETQQRQQTLENLRQATAGIDDVNRKVSELEKAIQFFESKLPAEKEVDKVLKEVWKMAEANNLATKTVKTLKAERNANYSEQPIQMNLTGDFNGFYVFLQQLERLSRIIRVNQMNLQKINDTNGAMTAQLTMSVFFTPDTTGNGNGGQGAPQAKRVASAN